MLVSPQKRIISGETEAFLQNSVAFFLRFRRFCRKDKNVATNLETSTFDEIFIKLAGKEDRHKSSERVRIWAGSEYSLYLPLSADFFPHSLIFEKMVHLFSVTLTDSFPYRLILGKMIHLFSVTLEFNLHQTYNSQRGQA